MALVACKRPGKSCAKLGHPLIIYPQKDGYLNPKHSDNSLFFFANDNDPETGNNIGIKVNWNHENYFVQDGKIISLTQYTVENVDKE